MLRIIREAVSQSIDAAELYEELCDVISEEIDYREISRSLLERYEYQGIMVDEAEKILSKEY